MRDKFKEEFMLEPISTGFEHLTLSELKEILKDTRRHAVDSDKSFIKELTFEISRRRRILNK